MIMADKKKKKRRAHLDGFQKNDQGKYDYTGNVYEYEGSGGLECSLRSELLKLWGAAAVLLGSLIASGCVTAPGMDDCFYVLLPYIAALMAGISACWALCRLTSGGNPLKEYVYEASVNALPGRTLLAFFCAAVCEAGEIIYVCLHGMGEKTAGFCIISVLNVLSIVSSLVLRRSVMRMTWTKYGKT